MILSLFVLPNIISRAAAGEKFDASRLPSSVSSSSSPVHPLGSSSSFSSFDASSSKESSHLTRRLDGLDSSSKRAHFTNPATTISISIPAGSTDSDATALICNSGLNVNTTDLDLTTNSQSDFYLTANCIASQAPNLLTASLRNIIVGNWSHFPSSLTSFDCTSCRLTSATVSQESTGYLSAGGDIDWDFLRAHFPVIASFGFISSRLMALPSTLPPTLQGFSVRDNGTPLGNIPESLYSLFTSVPSIFYLSLTITNSGLNGTIPAALFTPLSNTLITQMSVSLISNALSGSIPETLFQPFAVPTGLRTFSFYVNMNSLSGTIPAGLFPKGLVLPGTTSSFLFGMSNNRITGPLPELLLARLNGIYQVSFFGANNRITGPLPNMLLNNTWVASQGQLDLSLSGNNINGTIPETFLSSSFPTQYAATMLAISISLDGNQLVGTIPSNFFVAQNSKRRDASSAELGSRDAKGEESSSSYFAEVRVPTQQISLGLAINQLTGSLPGDIFVGAVQSGCTVSLDVSSNALSGSLSDLAVTLPTIGSFSLNVRNNSISGSPPVNCNSLSPVLYRMSLNQLNGTISSKDLAGCTSLTLDVAQNPNLSGTIPPELFNLQTLTFLASHTGLNGTIPKNLTIFSGTIDLSASDVDFCTSPWDVAHLGLETYNCILDSTSAACECPMAYQACSHYCPPPSDPVTPVSEPLPQECPTNTRPSEEFVCVDGVWTAPFTTTPILTIPSGAGTVVVDGNVTSTSIVINGVGSNIVIRGCAANLTMVTVTLTQEQLKELGSSKTLQNLVTLSNASACDTNLNGLALDTQVSHGCRKVKTEKVVSSDGNTFGAYFTVNSSGCNTWWIILVSVVCGVIVLGVVAAIIAGVLWNNHKKKRDFGQLSAGSAHGS